MVKQACFDLQDLGPKLSRKEQWMVAAWIVEDGKIKMVDRITHQFPTDDFLAAIGQLADNCHVEKLKCDKAEKLASPRQELPSDPLPQVKVFKMPCYAKETAKEIVVEEGNDNIVNKLAKGFIVEDENALLEKSVNGNGYPKIDDGDIELPINENGKTE